MRSSTRPSACSRTIPRSVGSCASAPTSPHTRTRSTGVWECRYSTWSRWSTGFIARCGRSFFRRTDRERDRLDRRLATKPPGGLELYAEFMRCQLGGSQTAEPALAASHAAARDRLQAVDLGRAEFGAQRCAQLAGGDVFAAAHCGVVIDVSYGIDRPREGIRQPPLETAQTRDLAPHGGTPDTGRRDLEIIQHRASRKRTGQRCDPRSADRRAIARDVDTRATASVAIGPGQPLAECRVEAKVDSGKVGKLRLGFEPEAVSNGIARDDMLAVALVEEPNAFHASCALECRERHAVMHRHAGAPERRHIPESARQRLWRNEKISGCSQFRSERRAVQHRGYLCTHRMILFGGEV